MYVPKRRKIFFKYWWDEQLSLLKAESIEKNNIWKAAGKPRKGPIFANRRPSHLLYHKRLRENQRMDTQTCSNDLHEALLTKNNTAFWKTWRSKFNKSAQCGQVDGCVDAELSLIHISEPTRRTPISYAVFCLKKISSNIGGMRS